MAVSGSNPNPEKDRPSSSPFPSDALSKKRLQILVVEDSRADLFLIREAIATAKVDAVLHVAHDGQQAIEFLERVDGTTVPCPDLVLLDINLPRKDGIEVLHKMRNTPACKNATVLVVSSSDSENDREAVNTLGIHGYFRKPSAYAEFMKLGSIVRELLARGGSDCK
jgi:CheY-like chemotaxis protein